MLYLLIFNQSILINTLLKIFICYIFLMKKKWFNWIKKLENLYLYCSLCSSPKVGRNLVSSFQGPFRWLFELVLPWLYYSSWASLNRKAINDRWSYVLKNYLTCWSTSCYAKFPVVSYISLWLALDKWLFFDDFKLNFVKKFWTKI